MREKNCILRRLRVLFDLYFFIIIKKKDISLERWVVNIAGGSIRGNLVNRIARGLIVTIWVIVFARSFIAVSKILKISKIAK